jgi:ribonucleoside-diphosphate reductase alpha chain
MYTKEQVIEATLDYFKGDGFATDVFVNKYCLRDRDGNYLEKTPDDIHRRLAKEFTRIEQKYLNPLNEKEIYSLLKDFKYIIPQGSPMAGIGNNHRLLSLSNCFVIDSAKDSYTDIIDTEKRQIYLMKRRGGVGHDLSNIRPKNVKTSSVAEKSSGIVLFGERYSRGTREVAQDGRRGALMLSISIDHPDAESFIDAKLDRGMITGANISVRLSDSFIKAALKGEEYEATYTNHQGEFKTKVNAKKLWDKIIHNAWKSAEPGVLFWDNILRESIPSCYGDEWRETSTNPCSEIPLCPYDSCRLMAINLYSYIEEPFTEKAKFNFEKFKKHVRIAQRLMDDIVDLEFEKIDKILHHLENDPDKEANNVEEIRLWKEIRRKGEQGRRTGLGITAEGDMIAAMGLRYGTKEATELSIEVHKTLAVESYKSSIEMAKERGCFPIWDYDKEKRNPFINRVEEQLAWNKLNESDDEYCLLYRKYGRRNIANLTIAPTGSVSACSQTTSGIEPAFLIYYKRRRKVNPEDKDQRVDFIDETGDSWQEYNVFHHKFVEWWKVNFAPDHTYQEALSKLQQLKDQEIEELIEESPYYKATSNDIDWEESVKLQGEVQKWVDHSISKTVNVPENTPVSIIDNIYRKAYESGCKGVTVYRDGCRSGILVNNKDESKGEFEYKDAFKRPEVTDCDIYHKTALKKDWTVLVGKVGNNPYEIFVLKQLENSAFPHKITKGKIKKNKSKNYSLIGVDKDKRYTIDNIINYMLPDERVNTRKVSSMLRHGMHPEHIVSQIREYASITSFDKVVERVLKNYTEEKEEKCPNCGDKLLRQEGCVKCTNCTYSVCG